MSGEVGSGGPVQFVARALAAAGREVRADPDGTTIDVAAPGGGFGRTLALVRAHAHAVTLYAVHPRPVRGDGALAAVRELVARATGDLFDACLEIDRTGVVAARQTLLIGDLEPTLDELAALLRPALAAVEDAAAAYGDAVDAVAAGELDPVVAAAQVRHRPLGELAEAVDEARDRLGSREA